MTVSSRWYLAAAVTFPLISMTAYLLWVWPRPRGTSALAEAGPYLLSLLTGLPFVWRITRGTGRSWLILVFIAGGFGILWIYALAVLCGVRNVCL